MNQVLVTPLRRIPTSGGDVYSGMKCVDQGFSGFGEAYFTTVQKHVVKGWKRHSRMTLNLVVPCGEIQISVLREADEKVQVYRLGPDHAETYLRLTIPPGFWVAFGGIGSHLNLMLNMANIPHDPTESDSKPLEAFPWTWIESAIPASY
jgi:dTDP-4-dehydrorhamnose 3,5-epimerase